MVSVFFLQGRELLMKHIQEIDSAATYLLMITGASFSDIHRIMIFLHIN